MSTLGRRRRFLIDKLQYKLLAINVSYFTVVIFLFMAVIFAPAILTLSIDSSFEQEAAAANEFLNLHRRIWPAVPVALLLISLHSIIVSHRIAGPLYRFRNVFGMIEKGDLRVRAGVREKDYLLREADTINEMIDGLSGKLGQIRHRFDETRAACDELEALAEHELKPGVREAIRRLKTRLERLDDGIGRFELPESAAVQETTAGATETSATIRSIADARR